MATKKRMTDGDPSLKELRNVRKLLMLLLVKLGATSDEIDFALGMGAGNIRAMLPFKKIRKVVDNP